MAKDPATLWYWNDFITGTMTFSRHLKGCYIDLLGAQFNEGRLSLDQIKTVLGSDFGLSWPTLQKKFKVDENGLYYNLKAEETKNKRSAFSQSRRSNLGEAMSSDMENEIENRKLKFETEVGKFKGEFPEKLLLDFKEYWLEKNKSGTKFRFEDQKYFDFKKRLGTFLRNDKEAKYTGASINTIPKSKKSQEIIKKYANG